MWYLTTDALNLGDEIPTTYPNVLIYQTLLITISKQTMYSSVTSLLSKAPPRERLMELQRALVKQTFAIIV